MITLIRNGKVYNPQSLGNKDILLVNDKIEMIEDRIELPEAWDVKVIEATGKLVVPGYIDTHVHILGGGSGAYQNRVPEIGLSDITRGGITSILSFLGTDSTTKTLPSLIGKARGLIEEGISVKLLLGSYHLPTVTLSGSIVDDIVLSDLFIGVKAAANCSFAANGTTAELGKAMADCYMAGGIAGKAGITIVHMGESEMKLLAIEEALGKYDLPKECVLPTHINRCKELLEDGLQYMEDGGLIDLTTIIYDIYNDIALKPSRIIKDVIDKGLPLDQLYMSTDANGQISDKDKTTGRIETGDPRTLHREIRDAVLEEGVGIEEALSIITTNPAKLFKLEGKGRIEVGYDADINLLDESTLELDTTIANGIIMVEEKRVLRFGAYEPLND